MCGISGCVSKKSAMGSVMRALNKLQNRGYDSAGICTILDKQLAIKKYVSDQSTNAMVQLNADVLSSVDCDIAIGHTRWATHGSKTLPNAHPHCDDRFRYAMVHNGIIENYSELRSVLVSNGYKFYGETDTEVTVKYLDFIIRQGRPFCDLGSVIKGSWAILFADIWTPNKIYYLKNGSPLIVGFDKSQSKIMLVSEFVGFDSDIETCFVVGDNEYGTISIDNFTGKCVIESSVQHELMPVPDISVEISPAPYAYWTLKEINDQPLALNNLLTERFDQQTNQVKFPELDTISNNLVNISHIIFLACGTSYHAAKAGERFFKELRADVTVDVIDGSDFEVVDIPPNRKTMLVLLSQSGETKDLYRALIIGKNLGIKTIGLINVKDSLIAREVDVCLYLNAGREHAVASTKSFTNQVIMLLLLSIWFSPDKTDTNVADVKQLYYSALKTIVGDYKQIIDKATSTLPGALPIFLNKSNCFVLGKHLNEWIAKEGSLKIKEISYIHSEGFSAAALKHGPFALLSEGTPIVLLANNDEFYSKIENVMAEVKSRLASVLCVTNKRTVNPNIDHMFYYDTESVLFPLMSVVPLQVLAYYLSLDRNINPDYPRNLAKVVTVE